MPVPAPKVAVVVDIVHGHSRAGWGAYGHGPQLRTNSQKLDEPKFRADEPGAGVSSGPSCGVITAVFAIGVSR